ncbi:hypothetical protein SDRG_13001 [Saprolegnia diclina VS20]|uniref:Uncharacterized protein n=1 Tax=Saprolegnia diclina (strain VS20) TaxID=1156394 RepID=T0RHP2_SAPDV|nr:hypothetical protein SDRG_13001 [Saprolegnia diclina VS20]EQC29332.1 hypothetical protein SDRG_13001 [Saprolegnia diclina VS20]|eukprot:XP_008617306.1 hypothetical protein SDRG_13001 [Saprolegnia diclina VS20]
MQAIVVVKLGSRAKSRTTAGQATMDVDLQSPFSCLHDAISLEVQRIRLACNASAMAAKEKWVMGSPDPLRIHFKSGVSKKQAEYVELDSVNFIAQWSSRPSSAPLWNAPRLW